MSHWTLIFIAAAANVVLNLCLRQTGRGLNVTSARDMAAGLIQSPWTWLSVLSAAFLVTAFVAAVREYSLSLTYTAVTAIAMVVLTALGVALQFETVSAARVAGLILIVSGLILTAVPE